MTTNSLLPEDAVCRLQARCTLFQLPRAEGLRWDFGVRGSGICPMAGVSVLFDVLHGWALDPVKLLTLQHSWGIKRE
ncbi:MAG: hypothetical protein LBS19_05610 [Clostridiales bacterium]|nr:hypothetical protein [Clostridiales bacterium]